MNSPTQLSGVQQRLAQSSSPYFQIALYAAGNVLAVAILLLVWFGWGILAAFQEPLLWAWLCSLSLRDVKRYLVSTARRELLSSSFIVCCAKLVFLPAVIAWQVFEEVRDKLQAKYHELQTNSQATCQNNAAACAGAAATAAADATSAVAGSCGNADTSGSTPSQRGPPAVLNTDADPAAVGTSGAGAQQHQAKGNQVLRQRKAASKQQQSHHNHQPQRPPLGPRSNSTAAAAGSHKQGAAAAARHKAAAGAPAAPGAKVTSWQALRKQQQGPTANTKAASPMQQRLMRLRDFVRQLFSSYGFITMELLRFILGGLLPRRPSSDQPQQQQQQQRQQQQQMWPVSGLTSSTLPAASLPVGQLHVPLPPYLDLNCSSMHPAAAAAGSLAESSSGSARSECNMPWTPHPHWQQLIRQQQQQQQGMLSMLQQQQHSQRRRLSSSSSTPSLQQSAAASQQASPRVTGSSNGCVSAGIVMADPPGVAGLELHMTSPAVPDAGHSFSGWAGMLQQPSQQQQQQQLSFSRCGSVGSCTASHHSAAAAAAGGVQHSNQTGDGSQSATTAAFQQQQQQQQQQHSMAAMQTAAPPTAASLPGALPVPLAVSGHHTPAMFLSGHLPLHTHSLGVMGTGVYEGSSSSILQGGYWEGLGAPRSPPGSTTGVAAGSSGGSSPSAVLFKGLLRGIVLYEGHRYVQGFLAAEQSLFIPLLALGLTLALAGGLPFLLLPASLLKPSPVSDSSSTTGGTNSGEACTAGEEATAAGHKQGMDKASNAAIGSQRVRSPFSDAAAPATAATAAAGDTGPAKPASGSSSSSGAWCHARELCSVVWLRTVSVLVRADTALRTACTSGFLDTAVSGLIVVGLILGSVVLTAVLLVQVGDESRQAVVSLNTLVRQKGTEAGLTEGVWSLVQQYEGQLVGMTQYVLQEALPGLTHYVEDRASAFLISHNMSKVLIDWEVVRTTLKLPADCGDEARLKLAVQLANSSLAESQLGQQRQQLQQQLQQQQKKLGGLAAQLETLWIHGSSGSSSSSGAAGGSSTGQGTLGGNGGGGGSHPSSSSSNSSNNMLAQEVLEVQAAVERLQEQLHSAVVGHEAASEQLKLAELRMHNCQPASASSSGGAAAAAAGIANAAQGRGLLANILGGFTAGRPSDSAAAGDAAVAESQAGRVMSHHGPGMTNPMSHVRGMLAAMARLDFTAAGHEVTAMLGQLMPEDEETQQQQQQRDADEASQALDQQHMQQQQQQEDSCSPAGKDGPQGVFGTQGQPLLPEQGTSADQCPSNTTCSVNTSLGCTLEPQGSSSSAAAVAVTKQGRGKGSSTSSSSSGSGTSLVRVARGAAYPLITMLRHVSSVVVTGLGSTTALALGTGLGVLRLGLGVAKFLVQLGVFASVLYTLLALDIDPVEQLVKLLPISEASQDRASRAVTKALRGVFVSSLKLAAFHAGFTWLTLRAFGTHFVCTATIASAIVAVLPLVPVYLTVLPAVLELGLVRGAAVKGLVLLALHVGAYTFGDDLIYREIEPTLPYLVGLGVFGGMWHFANPLQGVLLGPMVLALLSVGYNLHREML